MKTRWMLLAPLWIAAAVLATAAGAERATDEWLTRPVDDGTFRGYLDFFAYDREVPFDLRELDAAERDGLEQRHLSFQSTPGVTVFADTYGLGASESPERRALILLHGGSASGKRSSSVKKVGELLARAGWLTLAMDLQYFGERSTDLLETFTETEKHERLYNRQAAYLAWITQSAKDVSRAYDLLVEEFGADPKRVALVGFSRGAQVASIAGAVEPRFAAVALLHGGHFDAMEKGHRPAACPANYIRRISPTPLLMINSRQDSDYEAKASVLPLQELAGEPKKFRWSDTGHGRLTDDDLSALVQWLDDPKAR